MNENINLCEILKDCPINTEFYSPILGDCKLSNVNSGEVAVANSKGLLHINPDATAPFYGHKTIELMLFPSKDQRDWSKFTAPWYKKEKFDPKTLKAFDKVIARNEYDEWSCTLFSHINNRPDTRFIYETCESVYEYCIPYNDETKLLVGTKDEAPEYYRYWED